MDSRKKPPTSPLYAKLLCWLGPFAALLLAFQIELGHIQEAFDDIADKTTYEVENKLHSFELALEGFAYFLAIAGDVDDEQIRAYVQGIRKLYPDLYLFEIASRIESQQRDSFEKAMRDKGYQHFVIHGFDYDGARQVTAIEERPFYYPIRFIEPESPATSNVLGLDLSSTSNVLVDTMMKSITSPRPMASRAFELLEGGRGYVIYRPVTVRHDLPDPPPRYQPIDFAMLVIKAEDLLPRWLQGADSYLVSLSYKQAPPNSPTEALIEPVSSNNHYPSIQGIRSLKRVEIIDNESQPLELSLTQLIRWSDLNLFTLMIVTFSGSLVAFYLARALTQDHHRKWQAQKKQQQLYRQANFDPLTNLPNVNLLFDRTEQAIRQADRANGRVGICYLDINKFKMINDTWGHNAGNEALVEIASRLINTLRSEDTAARIHGDEFVILLPDIDDKQSLGLVTHKILSIFSQPFSIAGRQLTIMSSIGSALYPDDAQDLESLLHISDQRMYQHKPDGMTEPATAQDTPVAIPYPAS